MVDKRGAQLLALIPARGGSKGIPRKNLQELGGQPLIAWTIKTALASRSVDRVVVSTEDHEIANCAREWGAEVPFIRPASLADDTAQSIPVLIHALEWMSAAGDTFDYVCLIQPTSPFVSPEDIDAAYATAVQEKADSVLSVTASHTHPYFAKRVLDDGKLVDFGTWETTSRRRQDLPPAFALNGAIYLVRTEILLATKLFDTDHTYALVMPQERSMDIDSPWDLHLARLVVNDRKNKEA